MNSKFAALASVFLLASGCAQNGTINPPSEPDSSSPVAGDTSRGSSSIAMQQTSAGSPTGRTRAKVHAEAMLAVKNYKSTMQDELEYFQPH